ncbi:MAG: hypothetical protein JO264_19500 [Acidisphaera sp.]|nr:hypothetical protein [Acidisphaera sp.]
MKTLTIGSCLSNLTVTWLKMDYGFDQTHNVQHMRSDAFVTYYVERTAKMIPLDFMNSYLKGSERWATEAQKYLLNQYRETLGFHELLDSKDPDTDFFQDIQSQKVDVIVMDNFMDVAAQLMRPKNWSEWRNSPLFLNPHFYANQDEICRDFEFTGHITPEDSAACWLKIYRFIRKLQPAAKMFFLSFMYATSTDSAERYHRAREFYLNFSQLARGEDLFLVPPLDLPLELHIPGDWSHVDGHVYRALAGYIYLHSVAGMPRPEDLHRSAPTAMSPNAELVAAGN